METSASCVAPSTMALHSLNILLSCSRHSTFKGKCLQTTLLRPNHPNSLPPNVIKYLWWHWARFNDFICHDISVLNIALEHTVKFWVFEYQFSSVQSLSRVWLFVTPWIAAHQASLSITNSWSSLKLTSFKSVMPSSHLILCRPLLLLPSIPPSIRVFPNESTLHMRWPKYQNFSFSIIPSKEIPGLTSFRMD